MTNQTPTSTPSTTAENGKSNRSQAVSILIPSVLIMIIAAVLITQDMNKIKAFISQSGGWGILVSILLYAVLGLTLIPSEPLTVFIGVLFGPLLATLIAGVGNTASTLVEYFIGTRIGSAANFEEKREKLPFGLGHRKVDSPLFLIGGRMIPGYAPKVISMLAGIYKVPILRFLWTSAIPNFVGAAILAFGGFGIGALLKIK